MKRDGAGRRRVLIMGNSSARGRLGGCRTWLCGALIAGMALTAATAGAVVATRPGAPKVTSVKAGVRMVTVAFVKPAHDGGSRVLSYRASCVSTNHGHAGSHSGTHSPIVVPELTAAKTYRCTVTAINHVGAGPASATSVAVVAQPLPPAAPPRPSVVAGTRSVTVKFTKPVHDGGAPVVTYRVVCTSKNGGNTRSTQSTKSPVEVGGLAAAATYRCTVAAGNNVGIGRASVASAPVVVRPTAPGTPAVKVVRPEWHGLAVAFVKPLKDGGSPITSYRAACKSTSGGVSGSRVSFSSPIHVNGLTPGVKYTCTVAASNNVTRGPPSKPSKPAVPLPH